MSKNKVEFYYWINNQFGGRKSNEKKWESLIHNEVLFTNNYQKILAELKNRIEYVDLRYKDGFSVKKLNERLIIKSQEKNIL